MEWLLKEVSFKWIHPQTQTLALYFMPIDFLIGLLYKGLVQRLCNGFIDWVHEWITR